MARANSSPAAAVFHSYVNSITASEACAWASELSSWTAFSLLLPPEAFPRGESLHPGLEIRRLGAVFVRPAK